MNDNVVPASPPENVVPDYAPDNLQFTVTITYTPGVSVEIEYPGLQVWECRSVLNQARTLFDEDEEEEEA
jgi:hypothetical protein